MFNFFVKEIKNMSFVTFVSFCSILVLSYLVFLQDQQITDLTNVIESLTANQEHLKNDLLSKENQLKEIEQILKRFRLKK